MLVLPSLLVWSHEREARREFALRPPAAALPHGALPRAERAWWGARPAPPLWQLCLLVGAAAMTAWRVTIAALAASTERAP